MSRFRFVSAGESHGPRLTVIITGMPAGVRLDRARIDRDLARRQHGYGRGGRMKIEHDVAEVVGGVRGGETIGAPIALAIQNRDFDNWRGAMDPWSLDDAEAAKRRVHAPRPGHVDGAPASRRLARPRLAAGGEDAAVPAGEDAGAPAR